MNARIIKETRSLLPVFGVMLLGAVCPPLIWRRDTASGVGMFVFVTCAAIMAASSFGNEFQWRTLSMLLAQPLPRRRLWLEKMLVLAAGLVAGFIVFLACTYVPEPHDDGAERWALALIPLCALCGAPFLTLSIKNTIGAAAVIVVLPMAGWLLLAGLEQSVAHFFPQIGTFIEGSYKEHALAYLGAYGLVYCALSLWLGHSMFMDLQTVDSQARDINLPAGLETALARPLRRLVPGYTGPWASLFRKELQLQRVSFIIAGLMLALAPLQLVAWKLFHSEIAVGSLGMNLVMCVLVIPLVATGMCVAEERNLGVAGWQFIQPVSARKQWSAKMLVVLLVCVTLGVALPAAGLGIGNALFHSGGFNLNHSLNGSLVENLLECLQPVLFYLLLLSLGVFASSLSRTTLQAIVLTIALIGLSLCVTALIVNFSDALMWHYRPFPDQHHGLFTQEEARQLALSQEQRGVVAGAIRNYVCAIGMPLLALWLGALQSLAYANFRKGEQAAGGGRIKWSVLAVVISGFAIALVFASQSIAMLLARIYM